MFRPKKSAGGFTLVEMIVVIVIIAILSVLLVPVGGQMRNKALLAGCVQNMRQVGTGLNSCAQENNGNYPPTYAPTWAAVLVDGGYITDTRIFLCPGDTLNQVAHDPTTGQSMGISYSYCSPVMTGNTYVPTSFLNRYLIARLSKQYLLVEWHHVGFTWPGGGPIRGWDGSSSIVSPTHKGGCNFLFADGHVEWRTQKDIDNPRSGWVLNEIVE